MANAKKERPDFAVDYVNGDWDQVTYTDNVHIDNLMDAIVGLGTEVWALKRRNMVLEKLLNEKHSGLQSKIEAYVPTDEERVAWAAERDDFISRIYTVLARVPKDTSGDNPTDKVPFIDRS
ncbi:MAG: hypothetical protein KDE14_07140 [Rhodobacteraceae bacterium]|nr:hypothetical protein [Paracoccaceae bacterium]